MIEDEGDGYELFRRAILQRDEDAWGAIYARYRPLLIAWASRSRAGAYLGAECADIADQALARAWAALTPEHFAAFPTLAKLLSYLRTCVETTAIDGVRAQASRERLAQRLNAAVPATPEQAVLAEIDRAALWRAVIAFATTPAEHLILLESFAYGLPPRVIQERHPQIFASVTHVYDLKCPLLARLQRRNISGLAYDFPKQIHPEQS